MKRADGLGRRILCGILLAASALLLLLTGAESYLPPIPERYAAHHDSADIMQLAPMPLNWLLNAGDADALDELPGIGPTLAERIIQNREADGSFYFPEDIMEVKGIGEKTFQGIQEWLNAHPENAYVPLQE
ncbi:MAG: helix-hairpin-helix domain-containing protein [Clostridia bacterium]|nr:helix-hairpin-helix domain-containing protein [Clostridia bacterium]